MNRWVKQTGWAMVSAVLLPLLFAGAGWATNPNNEVFVLGDSLSDPGNLYELTGGLWPPSPPYAMRNCNGEVWAEYFEADLGVPVYNYAVGGALSGTFGVVSNFYRLQFPAIPGLPGVSQQVETLLNDQPEGLNPDALYVIWVGANDFFLGLALPGDPIANLPGVLGQTLANIVGTVCQLGAAGARHFAVGNMPDIGLTPFAAELGSPYPQVFSAAIADFNGQLGLALNNLPESCAETLVILDTYGYLGEVSAHPEVFGLANSAAACLTPAGVCSNPDEYLFWDAVHPSTVGQGIFSDLFRAAFCGSGEVHPGLRGRPDGQPPPVWRGVCYGTK